MARFAGAKFESRIVSGPLANWADFGIVLSTRLQRPVTTDAVRIGGIGRWRERGTEARSKRI